MPSAAVIGIPEIPLLPKLGLPSICISESLEKFEICDKSVILLLLKYRAFKLVACCNPSKVVIFVNGVELSSSVRPSEKPADIPVV